MTSFSVVIPAHDEERVIGRCLRALQRGLTDGDAQIVVVANGCGDRTAAAARAFPGVLVVELNEASKPAALNAGDAHCDAFPRFYLDADVEVAGTALHELAEALPADTALVGSLGIRFDTAGASWVVRAFYGVFAELPYVSSDLVGLGLFGVSASGRARFEVFPGFTADDLYVQRLFAPSDRRVLYQHRFVVHSPRTLRALLSVRTRAVRGAVQLEARNPGQVAFSGSTGNTARALITLLVHHPWRLPGVAVYVAVTAAARRRAATTAWPTWERDTTSR